MSFLKSFGRLKWIVLKWSIWDLCYGVGGKPSLHYGFVRSQGLLLPILYSFVYITSWLWILMHMIHHLKTHYVSFNLPSLSFFQSGTSCTELITFPLQSFMTLRLSCMCFIVGKLILVLFWNVWEPIFEWKYKMIHWLIGLSSNLLSPIFYMNKSPLLSD